MFFKDDEKRRPLSQEEQQMLEWQRKLANQPVGVSDRTYYKDLDFKSIKDDYSGLINHYNTLESLLLVEAENKAEYKQLVLMRLVVFKRIEIIVNNLTFNWAEATASFSGSSVNRQEAYEAIIDEIKSAISSCSPPTDEEELKDFMLVCKHFVKWLLSESLDYSLGERVDSTDPQRYGLEHVKVQVAGGADAMQKGQAISQETLKKGKGLSFRKKGSTTPPTMDKEG